MANSISKDNRANLPSGHYKSVIAQYPYYRTTLDLYRIMFNCFKFPLSLRSQPSLRTICNQYTIAWINSMLFQELIDGLQKNTIAEIHFGDQEDEDIIVQLSSEVGQWKFLRALEQNKSVKKLNIQNLNLSDYVFKKLCDITLFLQIQVIFGNPSTPQVEDECKKSISPAGLSTHIMSVEKWRFNILRNIITHSFAEYKPTKPSKIDACKRITLLLKSLENKSDPAGIVGIILGCLIVERDHAIQNKKQNLTWFRLSTFGTFLDDIIKEFKKYLEKEDKNFKVLPNDKDLAATLYAHLKIDTKAYCHK